MLEERRMESLCASTGWLETWRFVPYETKEDDSLDGLSEMAGLFVSSIVVMSSSAFFSSIADRSINANASFNNNTFDVILSVVWNYGL